MKLRFDTRDTKPKLRALLLLTVAALAAAGALALSGAEDSGIWMMLLCFYSTCRWKQ